MSIDVYAILGIDPQEILKRYSQDQEYVNKKIKENYLSRLIELNAIINEILSNDDNPGKKLKKIEEILKLYLKYKIAFKMIKSQTDRENYKLLGSETLLSALMLEVEKLEGVKFEEERQMHIQTDKSKPGQRDGIRKLPIKEDKKIVSSTAYQVLGITSHSPINSEAVNNCVIFRIKASTSRGKLIGVSANEEMLDKISKYMWAYSKLATPETKSQYDLELMLETYLKSMEDLIPLIGNVTRQRTQQMDYVELAEGQKIRQIGELREGMTKKGEHIVYQYSLVEQDGEKEKSRTVYANINMQRLQTDLEYRNAVITLLTPNSVKAAKKILGGYIGELKNELGEWKVDYNIYNGAACLKFQKAKEEKDKNGELSKNSPHDEQDDETPGGH